MKRIISIISIIFALSESYAFEAKTQWTATFGSNGPSCPLYRKRVTDYYQRISEVEYANKAQSGSFTIAEINNMVELWNRTGVSLLNSEMAIFKSTVFVGDWAQVLSNSNSKTQVSISSSIINWESDKFVFPTDSLNVSVDQASHSLTIEVKMQYAQACLKTSSLRLYIKNADNNNELELNFNLDKTQWDLSPISYQYEQIVTSPVTKVDELMNISSKLIDSNKNYSWANNLLMEIVDAPKLGVSLVPGPRGEGTYEAYSLVYFAEMLINSNNPFIDATPILEKICASPKLNLDKLSHLGEKIFQAKNKNVIKNRNKIFKIVDLKIAEECEKIEHGEIIFEGVEQISRTTDCYEHRMNPFLVSGK